jgi:hypothetical protein
MNANYQHYEFLKAAWKQKNLGATPEQYQVAMARIAKHCGI